MEDMSTTAYDELLELLRDIHLYESVWSVVTWDSYTGLPPGGQNQRVELQGYLGKVYHRMTTNPRIGELLAGIEKDSELDSYDDVQKRNICLAKREYDETVTVPEEFFIRLMKQSSTTRVKREEAIAKQNWSIYETEFSKMFEYRMEYADHLKEAVGISDPYDIHFNMFERGMKAEYIKKIFADLTRYVVPMIKKYGPICEEVRTDFLHRPVAKEIQRRIIEEAANLVGYDTVSEKAVGRFGETLHPMSIGRYDDTRVLIRFVEDNFLFSYRGTLHECGHALYSMNLNREWMYQPVGMAAGFGVHESQAKFLEYIIGQSPEFLGHFLPTINSLTNDLFADVTPLDFQRATNIVKPGPIRVGSDELTFTLHIIIRFEIERDLFAGKIEVSDIPTVWNELYEKHLGVEVSNDAEGALQDIQWSTGQFGHFPCHTLGNIFMAQLVEKLSKDLPDWRDQMREGDVRSAIAWMTENIHKMGSLYDAPELIEHVTGKKITAEPFLNYLTSKYKMLYE
jgi:carboxypeptidase Taq